MMGRIAAAVAASVLFLAAGAAQAGTITVGGAWQEFSFDGVGSSWSDTFTLVTAGPVELKVTDAFLSGDRFDVSVFDGFATTSFLTSLPTTSGDQIDSDYDAAFADARWSSGSIILGAGSYTISGTAVLSPFGGGGAAIRADRVDPVPLPSSALMGLGLLGGIGITLRLRKRGASAIA